MTVDRRLMIAVWMLFKFEENRLPFIHQIKVPFSFSHMTSLLNVRFEAMLLPTFL